MTELAKYDAACRILAELVAVDEVQEIRNQAEAWRHYAHQAKNRDLEIGAAHIRFRAERRLGEIILAQKDSVGLSKGGRPRSEKTWSDTEQVLPVVPTLQGAGIDRKLSMRAQKMAAIEPEQFEELLELHRAKVIKENNKVSVDLMRPLGEAGAEKRRQLAQVLSDATATLPTGRKFSCVYADPPWRRKQRVSHETHYPVMTWDQICEMRVAELLLPDALVFLWIPRAHLLAPRPVDIEFGDDDGSVTRRVKLPLAWAIARAWGCDPYSTSFVCTKEPGARPSDIVVREPDELLLMFKRGRGVPKLAADNKVQSEHLQQVHEQQPDHHREVIRGMTGGMPVIELFARVDDKNPLPPNWHTCGNHLHMPIEATGRQHGGPLTETRSAPTELQTVPDPGDYPEIPDCLRRSADNVAPFFAKALR
jgi:N6-adenosine-specific RNA methylase IME4